MNNPDRKVNLAADALVILLALALLCFITRLWPILLLLILGISVAALRLVFLSVKQPSKEAPRPEPVRRTPRLEPTEREVEDMVFAVVCRKVNEMVQNQYPDARWIWELPDAKDRVLRGESVWILLNRAGGFRKAQVRLNNLQVEGLRYPAPPTPPAENPPAPEADNPEPDPEPPAPENYELLAFEWVESHILELNARCNEAVGSKKTTVLLKVEELPQKESWPAICAELAKQDIHNTACREEGIWIQLDGGAAA